MNEKEFVKEVCSKCESTNDEDCNIVRRMDGNVDCTNKNINMGVKNNG